MVKKCLKTFSKFIQKFLDFQKFEQICVKFVKLFFER